MAEWNREKVDSSDLNNGNEWEQGDRVARQELNAIINAGLYAQDFAEHLADTPDISEINGTGTASVSFVDNPSATTNKPYKRFKFSNLKGAKGDTGNDGKSVTNVTAGTPTISDETTTTPITFTFSDNTTKTVNVTAQNGEDSITVDNALSTTSTNPVQNKVVTAKLNEKVDTSSLLNLVYPIGAIYISVNQTNPANLFGGSWEALDDGYTLWTTTTANEGGTTISAGLPNITARLQSLTGSAYIANDVGIDGSFYFGSTGTHYIASNSNSQWPTGSLNFDASLSNSIYGNSSTVQPPAIKVYMWKRVQ